jgi:hypothetical protein
LLLTTTGSNLTARTRSSLPLARITLARSGATRRLLTPASTTSRSHTIQIASLLFPISPSSPISSRRPPLAAPSAVISSPLPSPPPPRTIFCAGNQATDLGTQSQQFSPDFLLSVFFIELVPVPPAVFGLQW